MDLSCHTAVFYKGDIVKDAFEFKVHDNSKADKEIVYRAEGGQTVEGTNLVVDEVRFEKSAIGIKSTITYHYAGAFVITFLACSVSCSGSSVNAKEPVCVNIPFLFVQPPAIPTPSLRDLQSEEDWKLMTMENLNPSMAEKDMKIADYAKLRPLSGWPCRSQSLCKCPVFYVLPYLES